ncbi:hypothetical protein WICPIJ_009128 [Wickerhamomyces pijperi]|uniref:LSM complex subunit LSM4 n=1 Tax=Wickerhamomyces pijperi TaxID=599730 RepID=A0A9P8PQ45_WICPI|nr:hypothetical protein WICPIJ_009128 [Wickerhamomyces pijperi]
MVTSKGQPLLIELKSGETLNGTLQEIDAWMNLTLVNVIETNSEGDEFIKLKEIFIRGKDIKYLRLPDDVIKDVKNRNVHDQEQRMKNRSGNSNNNNSNQGGRNYNNQNRNFNNQGRNFNNNNNQGSRNNYNNNNQRGGNRRQFNQNQSFNNNSQQQQQQQQQIHTQQQQQQFQPNQ